MFFEKPIRKVPGHTYRICAKCRKEWNVSSITKGGKRYICPICAMRCGHD